MASSDKIIKVRQAFNMARETFSVKDMAAITCIDRQKLNVFMKGGSAKGINLDWCIKVLTTWEVWNPAYVDPDRLPDQHTVLSDTVLNAYSQKLHGAADLIGNSESCESVRTEELIDVIRSGIKLIRQHYIADSKAGQYNGEPDSATEDTVPPE